MSQGSGRGAATHLPAQVSPQPPQVSPQPPVPAPAGVTAAPRRCHPGPGLGTRGEHGEPGARTRQSGGQ